MKEVIGGGNPPRKENFFRMFYRTQIKEYGGEVMGCEDSVFSVPYPTFEGGYDDCGASIVHTEPVKITVHKYTVRSRVDGGEKHDIEITIAGQKETADWEYITLVEKVARIGGIKLLPSYSLRSADDTEIEANIVNVEFMGP